MVRMRHETLPDQDIEVPDISVHAYERMGWTVVEPEAKTTAAQGRRREKGDS
ncbi:hypothetical protein [Streptomyces sp. NPDC058254]|uniref:hypothetical protein n=1 Tax=Streptomyces sp. NPDC058254 TaxID=3346406 RepID=UPI0036EE3387